jgi:hypothetical protein
VRAINATWTRNICAPNDNDNAVLFYDKNGNMIEQSEGPSSTTWLYSYNDMNQMVSATEYTKATGGTLMQQGTYIYDVFGNLIEEDVYNGSTTTVSRYVRDGWNPDKPAPIGDENYDIYAVLNGSNALQTTYMPGDATAQTLARISVYNLEVDGDHVYRVGESGVLVHNSSAPVPGMDYGCENKAGGGRLDPCESGLLATKLGGCKTDYQAHHLIACSVRNSVALQRAAQLGFDINGMING